MGCKAVRIVDSAEYHGHSRSAGAEDGNSTIVATSFLASILSYGYVVSAVEGAHNFRSAVSVNNDVLIELDGNAAETSLLCKPDDQADSFDQNEGKCPKDQCKPNGIVGSTASVTNEEEGKDGSGAGAGRNDIFATVVTLVIHGSIAVNTEVLCAAVIAVVIDVAIVTSTKRLLATVIALVIAVFIYVLIKVELLGATVVALVILVVINAQIGAEFASATVVTLVILVSVGASADEGITTVIACVILVRILAGNHVSVANIAVMIQGISIGAAGYSVLAVIAVMIEVGICMITEITGTTVVALVVEVCIFANTHEKFANITVVILVLISAIAEVLAAAGIITVMIRGLGILVVKLFTAASAAVIGRYIHIVRVTADSGSRVCINGICLCNYFGRCSRAAEYHAEQFIGDSVKNILLKEEESQQKHHQNYGENDVPRTKTSPALLYSREFGRDPHV